MTHFQQPLLALGALALAACSPTPDPVDRALPPPTPDQQYFDCIAGGDPAPLIGLPASQAGATHAGPVRIIPPGMLVTQDYDIKRLNLMTDDQGIVLRAYCG